ncbi:hypothetical protein K1719_009463 [Acacia pycnantha]|nr:hypothetical protein K1719_009463 [Acacia pycnantha]
MDLIHELLNITLIPSTFFALLFLVPPFYVFKFLSSLFQSCKTQESVASKVVFITEASSGISEELAYKYARRGARLALVARREDCLRSILDKGQLGSPDAIIIPADDHSTQTEEFFEKLSDLAPIMDINFWGSVYATHFAVPHLRKSIGKIVVISSVVACFPIPRLSFYNISKATTISLFETLRT